MKFNIVKGGFKVTFSFRTLAEQAGILLFASVLVFEFFWFGAEQQCIIP